MFYVGGGVEERLREDAGDCRRFSSFSSGEAIGFQVAPFFLLTVAATASPPSVNSKILDNSTHRTLGVTAVLTLLFFLPYSLRDPVFFLVKNVGTLPSKDPRRRYIVPMKPGPFFAPHQRPHFFSFWFFPRFCHF